MTLESFLVANAGLLVIQQTGFFGHHQKILSHYDLYNDNFKVIFNYYNKVNFCGVKYGRTFPNFLTQKW